MEKFIHKFGIFKNGFTLAEVLITLVIIGVVAALVISPLINTYVESSTVSKVKKGLSILGQAKKLAEVQNGPIEGWNFGAGSSTQTVTQFWNYLKPHISFVKECSGIGCYQNDGIYYLNGSYYSNYNSYSSYQKIILADASVMWFRTGGGDESGKCSAPNGGVENACAIFWYDVNGDKSPNALGRDVFVYIMSIDGVYPHMGNNCSKNSTGWGCAAYIIKNGNMNYLH